MKEFNIYICGVGGQGVGLLAAAVAQAADKAGLKVLACDTHGLAQRGGVVSSHIRIGEGPLTPLVPEGGADLVLALERLEGMRGAVQYLKPGGKLIYYDAAYQPVGVRRGEAPYPSREEVGRAAESLRCEAHAVSLPDITDPRMQNSALLGRAAALKAVPGVGADAVEKTLGEMAPPALREENLRLFRAALRL